MPDLATEPLKAGVKAFWNRGSCETNHARSQKFSREYFEEIERQRYAAQPFIHSFAQFTRYHGKRVLEVGFGAGTDFVQWLRAGAIAYGIDLTEEALANLTNRIEVYGLPKPGLIQVGDAENLPFESNSFDLGYSYGVLHHTPNTEKAIGELVRVVRPGGEIKIMLYNRHSLNALNLWLKFALLKGRPWKSFHWVLWNHQENICTKAYTKGEVRQLLSSLKMKDIQVRAVMMDTNFGMGYSGFSRLVRLLARFPIRFTESWWGWNLLISARKS
jgi:ubiquinone/menaquinone biosynthesis C-methylase UbiE